jgi:DNA helicase-2/ATP-dependent DNA helicase PcrA
MKNRILEGLNLEQRRVVCHDDSPLLIIAGAGTGKTKTVVHRVAQLMERGVEPSRILLLTFSRRASAEMLRRVDELLARIQDQDGSRQKRSITSRKVWGGTFHATAAQLLRLYGDSIGLESDFTIHDRSDSEDLLDVVRTELNLAKTDRRFPKKGTCMAIYSMCVNSRLPIDKVLAGNFPWCGQYAEDLKRLFKAYVDRKELGHVLDYDDLLLFWHGLLSHPATGQKIRRRFDCVLVDEYQDTNRLQSEIIALLRPDCTGITVVGDDAQSIYSFRAATVRNILDFPKQFSGTTIVKLEQNYRSTQPILAATNAVIAQAQERYTKDLWSDQNDGAKPCLLTCDDEDDQAAFIVREVLRQREAGVDLRRQAVLFRASHHSITLEAELARHNIPFVKYGGLKFIEAAHVKDLLGFLRLAENPRDLVAGTRVLKLLPGIGPAKARQLMDRLLESGGHFRTWSDAKVPTEAGGYWHKLIRLLVRLGEASDKDMPSQVRLVRDFYTPLLEECYDNSSARLRDLEQIEQLAGRFSSRSEMLADLTLDPPASTEDLAGDPMLDEDYLVLSTIHSAKGLEWDAVYVIHASDGNIPSDLATGKAEQIDEELRLFYVALTRAKRSLQVCFPLRYYHVARGGFSDRHSYAQLTRFISENVKPHFDCRAAFGGLDEGEQGPKSSDPSVVAEVRRRARAMWS